jgi:lipid-binding SYLF domain-containing protein
MNRFSIISKAAVATTALAFSVLAPAATTSEIDTRVGDALTRFYAAGPNHRELARKASAVLVFPRVTKAGVGVGGEYGEGALEVNGATVGYYKVTGASVGATLGAARRSEVILFMTDAAREKFVNSKGWTIGADAGVAVVKGAGADMDSQTLQHPVLAFVFGEKGLIGDVSLEGAKISKIDQH